MVYLEVSLLGLALAMDACAVSMSNGLNERDMERGKMLLIALTFGLFQAIMPLTGYGIGEASSSLFKAAIAKFDHWIAFILLLALGIKMIIDTFKKNKEDAEKEAKGKKLTLSLLLAQGVATSIDALAVGFSIKMMENANIFISIAIIGVITFIFSFISIMIGKKFGKVFDKKASLIGGLILITIGTKIFIEHVVNKI